MVVKHRSVSSSYVDTLRSGKHTLAYDDGELGQASPAGSMVSQPQWLQSQTASENQAPDYRVKNRKLMSFIPALMNILFFVAISYSIYSLHSELATKDNELVAINYYFNDIEDTLLRNDVKLDSARTSLLSIHSKFTSLLPGTQENKLTQEQEFNSGAVFQKIVDRQNAMQTRVSELHNISADLYRRNVIEQFGSQPYILKFNLLIHSSIFSFTVEMAPLDLMPHSVHHFMEMTNARVWDNSIFTHESKHILLAEFKDSKINDKHDEIAEKYLSTLSFPEYNANYPHDKYTLGFNGRVDEPGWYINTEDNRVIHGPGGQTDDKLNEEADPCFAKVIEGHDVIDWMHKRNKVTDNEIFTVIDSIEILL